ncbi:LysR family transcriptional regulator [Uliginosibacterium aquaticum]|uniref:LysR family transcriptional regulator n=1 Tax=Uliginosibacterium aquaticum TaxID=2731212 RepID=A0ABX2IJJ2_9RHOO|nr:LysR family transcriptional regulator [Uliginosibacterium aquaticum]NSL54804.1 LysR family transcriptional regulator [Uliginosibacterium aquaticum]
MELYQLRSFQVVARQGHLTQAAELLHLSQPAVTAQIKALEEELGVSLFDRVAGGVQLTDAGSRLLVDAERVLSDARALIDHAKSMEGELRGRVRIGTLIVPARLRLGQWLRDVQRRHPLLEVHTRLGLSRDLLGEIRRNNLDCGFFLGRDSFSGMSAITLAELGFCVAIPSELADALAHADWQQMNNTPWLGVSPRSTIATMTAELWRQHNIHPRVVGEFDDEATLAELIKNGLGLALLAERTARRFAADGAFVLWRGGEVVSRAPLQFIYPSEREGDPLLMGLRDSLKTIWDLP